MTTSLRPADQMIGALAERTGFPPKTIHYCQSIGLLPPPKRSDGGYRLHGADDESRLAFIATVSQMHGSGLIGRTHDSLVPWVAALARRFEVAKELDADREALQLGSISCTGHRPMRRCRRLGRRRGRTCYPLD